MPKTPWNDHQLQQFMAEIFAPGRTPRSAVYRRGCEDVLAHRLCATAAPACPYRPGSVEFDAYYAGRDEGIDRYNVLKSEGGAE